MIRTITLLLGLISASTFACIDKDFDQPPLAGEGVVLETNATVADLKEYFTPGAFTRIDDDLTVDAVVVADDKGGNFYKKLILQDETGGTELLLNRTDLYVNFENGRTVYLKARGLYVSDYNGVIQIGGAPVPDSRGNDRLGQLDDALIDETLLRGRFSGVPQAREVDIDDLGPSDISTLVKICGVQFASSDTSGTLANNAAQETLNRTLEDCDFNTLIVRTSGYASVGQLAVPDGGGCITGIYGVFREDRQLFIREGFDLELDGARCGGGGGGGAGVKTLTIEQVRGLWGGQATTIPNGQSIQGVVISDRQSGTTTNRNLVLQDGGYGITVRFGAAHTFNAGDEVYVDIGGVELSEFNGGLQLNNVPVGNARLVRANARVEPRVLTIAEILADFERYEGTLVRVNGAILIADEGNWAFNTMLRDGTGTINIFTYAQAAFANERPTEDTVDVIGYLNEFNAPQIILRTLGDVMRAGGTGGGTGGGAVAALSEDFQQGQTDRSDVEIPGWTNYSAVDGGRRWQARSFQGNFYAQATAFNDTAPRVDAWLITPGLELSRNLTLSFESATSFNVHQGLTALISTDYAGTGDPTSATWTPLPARLADGSSGDNNWVMSGPIDLSGYAGTGYIAFRYEGSGSGNTSTFRVDNVVVSPQ